MLWLRLEIDLNEFDIFFPLFKRTCLRVSSMSNPPSVACLDSLVYESTSSVFLTQHSLNNRDFERHYTGFCELGFLFFNFVEWKNNTNVSTSKEAHLTFSQVKVKHRLCCKCLCELKRIIPYFPLWKVHCNYKRSHKIAVFNAVAKVVTKVYD